MAEKLFLEVNIEGLPSLRSILKLNISQRIFSHHAFDLTIPSESIEPDADKLFDQLGKIIGKDITIEWETSSFKESSEGTDSSSFKGLVTDVSVSGERGTHMNVVIRGNSTTVLMDGVLNTNTYSDIKLKDIFSEVTSKNLVSKLSSSDNISHSGALPFTVQYNETDFNFISRVMYRYGEWFYYDGEKICLGVESGSSLDVSPRRVSNLNFSFNVSKPIPTIKSRDYLSHKVLDVKGEKPKHNDTIAQGIADESLNLFPANMENFMTYPSIADGDEIQPTKDSLKKVLDIERQGRSNQVFTINGTSDIAELRLGCVIKLDGFTYGGEYLVTSLNHSCHGKDNYQNSFSAVPVDSGIPSFVSISYPKMDDCIAIVTDNADPEKLGRVRVQFDWGVEETPWLRMLMPHTGKGRGFYFVPEVNDEVMVGFEMGNPDNPYVVGSVYNGKNKQDAHYDKDNKVKAIKTLGGNEIVFNDKGSLTIRNGKNNINLSCDSDGVLSIQTDGEMKIEAAKDLSITAGENVSITSGKNMALSVGAKMETSTGSDYLVKSSKNATMSSGMDFKISGGNNLDLEGTAGTNLSGAQTKLEGSATMDVKSSGITQVKGSLVKIN